MATWIHDQHGKIAQNDVELLHASLEDNYSVRIFYCHYALPTARHEPNLARGLAVAWLERDGYPLQFLAVGTGACVVGPELAEPPCVLYKALLQLGGALDLAFERMEV